MTVTLMRGVVARIREDPGAIQVQVGDASDVKLAVAALRCAAKDILNLDGGPASAFGLGPRDRNNPKWVSEVIDVPSGPILMVDGGYTPLDLLSEIPEIVAGRLEELGVSGVVRVPQTRGPLEALPDTSPCVYLRLFPTPPRRKSLRVDVPSEWLTEVSNWLAELEDDGAPAMCSLRAVEFSVPLTEAMRLLSDWERDRPGYALICRGEPTHSLHAVGINLCPVDTVELVFAAGGQGINSEGLVDAVERFQAIARRLAPTVAYAFVSIEPTFVQLLAPGHDTDWQRTMDGPGTPQAQWVCDAIVLDGFAHQILGPLHVARLADRAPGLRALTTTRWELPVGAPKDWLLVDAFEPAAVGASAPLSRQDPDIEDRARELLRPCLATAEEAYALMTSRLGASTPCDAGRGTSHP